MTPTETPRDEMSGGRPIVVDLVRAYEGILLGVVLVLLALVASAGSLGPAEFAAVIVVPGILMVLVMHRGAPREVFRVRATGAILGWTAAWLLFPPMFLAAYWAGMPLGGEYAVFTILAILDGVVLGLVMAAVDRIGTRLRSRRTADDT